MKERPLRRKAESAGGCGGGKPKQTIRRKPPGEQCRWKKPDGHQGLRVVSAESDPARATTPNAENLRRRYWQPERGSQQWWPELHNRTIPICLRRLCARFAK